MTENAPELYELSALMARQAELYETIADTPTAEGKLSGEDVANIKHYIAMAEVNSNGHFIGALVEEMARLNKLVATLALTLAASTDNGEMRKDLITISGIAHSHEESNTFLGNLFKGFTLRDEESKQAAISAHPRYFKNETV